METLGLSHLRHRKFSPFSGATAVVYKTYRDDQLVSSRNSFHNASPTELMGNSADAITAEEEGEAALYDYLNTLFQDSGNDGPDNTNSDNDNSENVVPPEDR